MGATDLAPLAHRDLHVGSLITGPNGTGGTVHAYTMVDGEFYAHIVHRIPGKLVKKRARGANGKLLGRYEWVRESERWEIVHDVPVLDVQIGEGTHLPARRIASWIAERATPIADSHEIDLHHIIRALLGDQLGMTWSHAPKHDGAETPAGMITRQSLITPGMAVRSHTDEKSGWQKDSRDGGIVVAIEETATGRIYTVIREGTPSALGGRHGLAIGHLRSHQVHWCDQPGCTSDPSMANGTRRVWQAIHRIIGEGTGNLDPTELELLNAATTLNTKAHI
jgi:hypothetical protein